MTVDTVSEKTAEMNGSAVASSSSSSSPQEISGGQHWRTFVDHSTESGVETVSSSMGFGTMPNLWKAEEPLQPPIQRSATYTSSDAFGSMGDLRDTRASIQSAPGVSTMQYGRNSFFTADSPAMELRGYNGVNDSIRKSTTMGRGFDSARHGTPARAATRSLLDEAPARGAATYSHAPRDTFFGESGGATNGRRSGLEFETGQIGFGGVNQMESRTLSFDDDGDSLNWGAQSIPPTPASFASLDTTTRHGGWEQIASGEPTRTPAPSGESADLTGWAVAVDEESVVGETDENGLREWTKATDSFSRAGSSRSVATRDNGVSCDSPWRRSATTPSDARFDLGYDDAHEWPRAPFDTPMSTSAWGDSPADGWPGTVARSLDFSTAGDLSNANGRARHHRHHHRHSKHRRQWDAFKVSVLGRRSSRGEGLRQSSFCSEMEDYLYLLEMTEHIPSVREMVIEPWAKYFAFKMELPEVAQEEEEEESLDSVENLPSAVEDTRPAEPKKERRVFVSILSYPGTLPRPNSLEVRLVRSDQSEILSMAFASRGEPLSVEVPADAPPNFLIELIFGGCELVARYQWAAAIACPGAPLEAPLEKRGRPEDQFELDEDPQKSFFACPMNLSTEVINFGIIPIDKSSFQDIFVRNESPEMEEFSFSKREDNGSRNLEVRIQPESSTVPPGDSVSVRVEVRATDPAREGGPFETFYDVHLGGRNTPARLHLMGTFVKQELEMVVEGADPGTVDFGQVYCGLRKTVKVRLVNKGPLNLPFSSSLVEADETPPGVIEASPINGVVKAFDTTTIHVSFRPPKYIERKGFKCTRAAQEIINRYQCQVKVESKDLLDYQLTLPVVGSSIVPTLSVAPSSLDFGGCPVDRSRRRRLWLLFLPSHSGNHQRDIHVMYCNKLYSVVVYAIGWGEVAGGPGTEATAWGWRRSLRTLPPEYKFVDQDEVKAQRAAAAAVVKGGARPITLTRIMKSKSTSMDHAESSMLLRSVLLERTGDTTQYALSPSGMQEHIRNKKFYNESIRKAAREGKKARSGGEVDIFGAGDVDLGMYRKVRSPRLSVDEILHDELYKLKLVDGGVGKCHRGVTGLMYQHDGMELLSEKHEPAPLTQVEAAPVTVNNIALFHKYPHLLPKEQQPSVQQERGSRKRSVSFDPRASQGPHQKEDPSRWTPCPMTEREQNLLKLICVQYLPKDSPTLTPSVRLKIRRYLQYLMFVDSGFKDFLLCNSGNAAKLLENIGRLLEANGNQRRPVHKAVQIATSACVKIPVELQDSEAIT
ncbi:chromosome X 22 [Perkinsus olseni]|uniref:Chromosome X 22 n=1 Tax=Perkinsus olseni TaxID=32597 RepID=A0A7J6NZY0_PEROL|nr:chromosome X 22 [Perkinsus olseni]